MLSVPVAGWIRFVLKFRVLVLLLSVVSAVLCGIYAAKNIEFKNKRLDLINPTSEWNQYWLEYIDKFGSADDLVILVEAPGKQTGEGAPDIVAAVDALAWKIEEKKDTFYSLFYRFDDSVLISKALHFASKDELEGLKLFLKANEGVFHNRWETLSVDRLMNQNLQPLMAPANTLPEIVARNSEKSIELMVSSLEGVFAPEYVFVSPFPSIDLDSRRNAQMPQDDSAALSSQFGLMTPSLSLPNDTSSSVGFNYVQVPTASVSSSQAIVPPLMIPPGAPSATPENVPTFGEILPMGSYMARYPDIPQYATHSTHDSTADCYAYSDYAPMNAIQTVQYATALSGGTPQSSSAEPVNIFDVALETSPDAGTNTASNRGTVASPPAPKVGSVPPLPSNIHYTWLIENRLAIMLVKMKEKNEEGNAFARGTEGIDLLRGMLSEVQERHPNVSLQLTGLPVMENDEMRSSQDAMSIATWLSIVGVTLLYIVFFRGLRHPMMAVFALFVGMGWSVGFITLFIGHLNILSISFAVILVGLGIDFGVHYTSRYLQCRREGDDTHDALVRAGREIGPGILTGALTTSAAFFMAGLTEFTGVAELGQIAGGGILLCCFSALTTLPILIYFSDAKRSVEDLPVPKNPNEGLALFQLHPRITLPVGIAIVAALGYFAANLRYDYNLLNLQAEGLESVKAEMRLIEESNRSVWFALSMSKDKQELRRRMEAFEALPSVDRVESLVALLPDENVDTVRQISQVLEQTPTSAGAAPILSIPDMNACLLRAADVLATRQEYQNLHKRILALHQRFCELRAKEYYQRMTNYQQALGADLLKRLLALRAISDPVPPQVSDLPQSYVERYLAPDGTFLLQVYGKGDLWDMDNLSTFVADVRSVDPRATGNPLQTYECSLQMRDCYLEAAALALATVVFLLYLDLRSIRHTFLALSPVALGMVCTFGIMGFFDISLNAANMIVLPLIIGIGIDDGVHIVHDFRHQHGKSLYRLTPSTAMSIILTSLTTIIGFGVLMTAEHRGLQSLGIVLSLGVTCCWLTSLLLLPALLSVFCRFAEENRAPDVLIEEERDSRRDASTRLNSTPPREESDPFSSLTITRYTHPREDDASSFLEKSGRAA